MSNGDQKVPSWGLVHQYQHHEISHPALGYKFAQKNSSSFLPYGLGRSYGDSCLNEGGSLLSTRRHLDHFVDLDAQSGILRCESGVTLGEILNLCVPRGWFLPVSPGTQFVTLGGAIANDIHGKNHHVAASFGNHVRKFELLKSDNTKLTCSSNQEKELFAATIGGLGLTGLILNAEIQLKPISSSLMQTEHIPFGNLDEFFHVSDTSDAKFEYTVAWIDSLASGSNLGRGVYMGANHQSQNHVALKNFRLADPMIKVPFFAPKFCLNTWSIKSFNSVYRFAQSRKKSFLSPILPFFYPLDSVLSWNKLYGRNGFYQFQCVVPISAKEALKDILKMCSSSRSASFLSVLKKFGSKPSIGMLSFPQSGYTLAMDFANRGAVSAELFKKLTDLVKSAGGKLYPAKDALMSSEDFHFFYPQATAFSKYIDPKFSSSFWRRVNRK